LENVLKQLEGRGDNDLIAMPGKYYFTVFGKPAEKASGAGGWKDIIFHLHFLPIITVLYPARPVSG